MTREQTEKLLYMFVGSSTDRVTLQHFMPVEWNGKRWCGATEGHRFIMIPENDDNKIMPPPILTVDLARILPSFNEPIPIDITMLRETLGCIQHVDVEITEECEACEGEGSFRYYGENYNCKSCEETGEVGTGRTENKLNPKTCIKIGDNVLSGSFIDIMLSTIDLCNAKRLEIRHQSSVKTIFEISGEIIIGSTHMIIDGESDYEILKCP